MPLPPREGSLARDAGLMGGMPGHGPLPSGYEEFRAMRFSSALGRPQSLGTPLYNNSAPPVMSPALQAPVGLMNAPQHTPHTHHGAPPTTAAEHHDAAPKELLRSSSIASPNKTIREIREARMTSPRGKSAFATTVAPGAGRLLAGQPPTPSYTPTSHDGYTGMLSSQYPASPGLPYQVSSHPAPSDDDNRGETMIDSAARERERERIDARVAALRGSMTALGRQTAGVPVQQKPKDAAKEVKEKEMEKEKDEKPDAAEVPQERQKELDGRLASLKANGSTAKERDFMKDFDTDRQRDREELQKERERERVLGLEREQAFRDRVEGNHASGHRHAPHRDPCDETPRRDAADSKPKAELADQQQDPQPQPQRDSDPAGERDRERACDEEPQAPPRKAASSAHRDREKAVDLDRERELLREREKAELGKREKEQALLMRELQEREEKQRRDDAMLSEREREYEALQKKRRMLRDEEAAHKKRLLDKESRDKQHLARREDQLLQRERERRQRERHPPSPCTDSRRSSFASSAGEKLPSSSAPNTFSRKQSNASSSDYYDSLDTTVASHHRRDRDTSSAATTPRSSSTGKPAADCTPDAILQARADDRRAKEESRKTKKEETAIRLQALQAIEERRRYDKLDDRLKKMEEKEATAGGVDKARIQALEDEVKELREGQRRHESTQAELVALRAVLEFQGAEILRLAAEVEKHGSRGSTLSPGNENRMRSVSTLPSPTASIQDRTDPNWLIKWQEQVDSHRKR
ncbi:hypothetical protein DIPPA_01582 [Diplonema papillatum]|nr:hypothetical protein DIPPA_32450 [Diplonema papillatum]KAJ9470421.1 hypothetical protein DIPPA_01582 [Diplonema papillatum]|eukprot:gene1351-2091_t